MGEAGLDDEVRFGQAKAELIEGGTPLIPSRLRDGSARTLVGRMTGDKRFAADYR